MSTEFPSHGATDPIVYTDHVSDTKRLSTIRPTRSNYQINGAKLYMMLVHNIGVIYHEELKVFRRLENARGFGEIAVSESSSSSGLSSSSGSGQRGKKSSSSSSDDGWDLFSWSSDDLEERLRLLRQGLVMMVLRPVAKIARRGGRYAVNKTKQKMIERMPTAWKERLGIWSSDSEEEEGSPPQEEKGGGEEEGGGGEEEEEEGQKETSGKQDGAPRREQTQKQTGAKQSDLTKDKLSSLPEVGQRGRLASVVGNGNPILKSAEGMLGCVGTLWVPQLPWYTVDILRVRD